MCKFFYEVGSAFEGVLVCQCVYEFGKILISMKGGGVVAYLSVRSAPLMNIHI